MATLDLGSVIVIHTAMMLAFSALFAAIYFVGKDWHFPWHFAAGFLVAPAVMVVPALGEKYGVPALIEIGLVIGFVGPALLTIGAARLVGVTVHYSLWLAAFVAFGRSSRRLSIGRIGDVRHLLVLNGAVAAFSMAFITIARQLPAEDHRLGRPIFIWIASGTAIAHLIRIPAIIIGHQAGQPWKCQRDHIVGMTVITAFIATSIIILVAERFAAKIRREARIDTLTGLALRRVFDDQLAAEFERWRRHNRPFAVVLFDIDHFKQVNDTHGHDVGDAALRLVATCGSSILRPNDLLARLGGDEFAMILPESALDDAIQVAERLLATLRSTPLATLRGHLRLTGSFGVATACLPGDTPDMVVKRADQALYIVKRRGRNGVAGCEVGQEMSLGSI